MPNSGRLLSFESMCYNIPVKLKQNMYITKSFKDYLSTLITDWVSPSGLKDPTTNTLLMVPIGFLQYCAPARPQYKDNRGSNRKKYLKMLYAILLLLWHC